MSVLQVAAEKRAMRKLSGRCVSSSTGVPTLSGPSRLLRRDKVISSLAGSGARAITLVAVVGVDAELVDDFKRVFAPVLSVHQGIVQWRAIITGEAVAPAE